MVLFSKSVYFDGFIFEGGIYFEVSFEAVLHELFERDDITKLSTIKQQSLFSDAYWFLKSHAAGYSWQHVTANLS